MSAAEPGTQFLKNGEQTMAGVAAAALSTAGKSVEAAMGALLSGDDAIRKPAEAFLKAFLKQPAAAGGLLEVMANSTAPAVRQPVTTPACTR